MGIPHFGIVYKEIIITMLLWLVLGLDVRDLETCGYTETLGSSAQAEWPVRRALVCMEQIFSLIYLTFIQSILKSQTLGSNYEKFFMTMKKQVFSFLLIYWKEKLL